MSPTEGPPEIPGLSYSGLLGRGGFADVYLYEQQMPRRKVAVKVLRNAGLTDALRQQFTAEANAMAALADHPNIVPVFSADITADGRPYLVMMYFPKANLGERAAVERFAVDEVLRIGIQIAGAVETAHLANILHRDIKPANILTSRSGAPGLSDFGIAGQVAAKEDDDAGVSVPWSPPEILYATAPASFASDVYSLGATLWHLLVGRSPYEVVGGDNGPYALMQRVRDAPVPSTGRADVPDSLERLLTQTLAKSASSRPHSAIDLARSLQAVEQELRLPRTEIVVLDERHEVARPRVENAESGPATRVRAPQRVDPQSAPNLPPMRSWAPTEQPVAAPVVPPMPVAPPEPPKVPAQQTAFAPQPVAPVPPDPVVDPAVGFTTRRPSIVGDVPAETARPGVSTPHGDDLPTASTMRRAPVAEPTPGLAPPPPKRRGISRGKAIGALTGAVAGAVAVAIVLSGGGAKTPKQTESTGKTNLPPQSALPPVTQTASDVKASDFKFTQHKISRTKTRLSWSYATERADDDYYWRYSGSPNSKVIQQPHLTLSRRGGHQTCVQIAVRRNGASTTNQIWSRKQCVS